MDGAAASWVSTGPPSTPSSCNGCLSCCHDEGARTNAWEAFDHALTLPEGEAMAAFLRLQVADDVELSAPPGPLPAGMANRPAGIRAFVAAGRRHRVEPDAYRRFAAPVYFS